MISRTRLALLLSGCLLVGNTLAASLGDGVVYSKTGTFNKAISFTDDFRIGQSGLYQATLKDLENTRPFTESSLEVSSGSDSLGSLSSPGAFTFEAGPGDYAVSLFASVAEVTVSDEEKQRILDDLHKADQAAGTTWWHSLSREQKEAHKSEVSIWSDEQRQANRERVEKRQALLVEEYLVSMSQGEYDIEIALLGTNAGGPGTGVSEVPVPAAVWLFGSGLMGLIALARRRS
jgi:hypothetical protein